MDGPSNFIDKAKKGMDDVLVNFLSFFDRYPPDSTKGKVMRIAFSLLCIGGGLAVLYFVGGKFHISAMVNPGLQTFTTIGISAILTGFGLRFLIQTLFSKDKWLTIAKIAAVATPILLFAAGALLIYSGMHNGAFTMLGLAPYFTPGLLLLASSWYAAMHAFDVLRLKEPGYYDESSSGIELDDFASSLFNSSNDNEMEVVPNNINNMQQNMGEQQRKEDDKQDMEDLKNL